MNQGRIWCVVHPTVGLPLLIGSAAVTSLIVHASVMTHTSWMSNYWEGGHKKAAALETGTSVASNVLTTGEGYTITVAPTKGEAADAQSLTITVAPKADAPVKLSSAADTLALPAAK